MIVSLRRGTALLLGGIAVALALAGCRTEYRGTDSGIDGVLWRQVASVEDPFTASVVRALAPDAETFFAQLPGERWDEASAHAFELDEPTAVVYDTAADEAAASFRVFFSSGVRADVATDAGGPYAGPDSVFTCYGWTVRFGPYAVEEAEQDWSSTTWEDCPEELVAAMPGTTAYAEPEVFGG